MFARVEKNASTGSLNEDCDAFHRFFQTALRLILSRKGNRPTGDRDNIIRGDSYRSNEEDERSVASKRSGSSGSPKARDTTPSEEEEEDLWTVWGELIRNWDLEVKRKPQYIKVRTGLSLEHVAHFRLW